MVEPAGHCWQIPKPSRYVLRAFLEDPSAFVLGEPPPRRGLANWNESRAGCMRVTEGWLPRNKLVLLGPSYVAFVAGESTQRPFGTVGHLWDGSSNDVQPSNIGKGVSDDGADIHNSPWTSHATYERKESGIHFDGYLRC